MPLPLSVIRACLLGTVVVLAGGCPMVGADLLTDKANCLDEDGDGAPRNAACVCIGPDADKAPGAIDCSKITVMEADCDDTYGGSSVGAERTPGNEEIRYDGIDNDCDGAELFDADGDSYPGILEADWVALHTGIEYDPTLQGVIDCDDDVATTNPGVVETYYDGVDANCDDKDDYDLDEDGHALKDNLLPSSAVDYTGALPQDDCDDDAALVFPGTLAADTFYDGVDQNCDGSNDFDQDGDNFIRTSDATLLVAYEDKYDLDFSSVLTGDCSGDPENPTATADSPAGRHAVSGASIHPGATDAFYDDVDANCDGKDDYDQDEDGFVPDDSDLPLGAPDYPGDLPAGDCVDTDEDIGPGALELIGDTADQDCDGGDDTTAFTFGTLTWDTPSRPVVAKTTVPHYLMAVVADEIDDRGSTPLTPNDPHEHPGVYFKFTPAEAFPQVPTPPVFFENVPPVASPSDLGDAVQIVTSNNVFFLATSSTRSNDHLLRVHKLLFFSPQIGYSVQTRSYASELQVPEGCTGDCRLPYYTDVDMIIDSTGGNVWALGCELDALHFISLNPSTFTAEAAAAEDYGLGGEWAGQNCVMVSRAIGTPLIHAFPDGSAKTTYQPDTSTPASIQTATSSDFGTYRVNDTHHHDDLVILSGGSTSSGDGEHGVEVHQGASSHRYLDAEVVLSADAAIVGPDIFLVAIVQRSGVDEIHLLHGPIATPTDTILPHVHPATSTEPTGVAIMADGTRVFVAASATGTSFDTVGWAFLGFAD